MIRVEEVMMISVSNKLTGPLCCKTYPSGHE